MNAIRRAGPGDADALLPLYRAFFEEDGIPFDAARQAPALVAMLEDDRAALWIAEEQATAVGLASASTSRGVEFGVSAEIEDLYVAPEHRGRGLARRLLETAIAWAEAEGAAEIILVITDAAEADQELSAFYRRFGFRSADRIMMRRNSSDRV